MKKATISDVAERAEVSVATVSRVINMQGGVKKSTEERILKAIKELNYVRNAVARSMVRKETKTISIIIPDICNPFFSEVVAGVEGKAIEKGYFTMLSSSNESKTLEEQIVKHIIERGVDGVIVTTADEHGNQLNDLFKMGIPVVAVDRIINNYTVDTIIIGNREGAYEAVTHLIQEGHRDIAIIRGPQNTTPGLERYKGYVQALEEYNISIREELVGNGDFKEQTGYEITKRFMEMKAPPTAIFSSNNLMSLGALKAIQEMKLDLAKDVSFIGFDDLELATFTEPQITTVSRPMRQLGKLAFQILYDRILEEDRQDKRKQEFILTPHLNIRGSCKKIVEVE